MQLPFAPAVYEYKAALIGRTVGELCGSAELLSAALLREYELFRPERLTVGVDIYNLEAEVLGAAVVETGPQSCPELAGIPFPAEKLAALRLPEDPAAGRFPILTDAARRVRQRLGKQVPLRLPLTGPATLAAKLAGVDTVLLSLCYQDGEAEKLLDFCLEFILKRAELIRREGFEAVLFDSMAAPPIFSPELYRTYLLARHRRFFAQLAESGQQDRELVIGGNTVPIVSELAESGATTLLCDYAADAEAFAAALAGCGGGELRIRRNISPELLPALTDRELERFVRELRLFRHPVAGTGILPYGLPPECVAEFAGRLERFPAPLTD